MKIPSTFKVGKRHYKVVRTPTLSRQAYGRIHFTPGIVLVATHTGHGNPRKDTGKNGTNHTFWHEVTHAILHDMGHKLNADEDFVDGFAQRLNQIIETAKFEEK